MLEQDENRLLATIYEQHWLHARHVENERLWFTNVYAIVLAGALSLLSEHVSLEFNVAVLSFLMLLSLIGILFSLKVKLVFIWHTREAHKIIKDHGFIEYWIETKKPKTIIEKISGSSMFPLFYAICFILLSCLLTYTLTECPGFLILLVLLMSPLPVSVYYLCAMLSKSPPQKP